MSDDTRPEDDAEDTRNSEPEIAKDDVGEEPPDKSRTLLLFGKDVSIAEMVKAINAERDRQLGLKNKT